MALTETRPDSDATVSQVAPASTTLDSLLATGDHKVIGRLWIGAGSLFLLASLVLAAVAALETTDLGGFQIMEDAGQFVQVWSLGREALLFAGLAPIMVGLATFLTPLQVGSSSIAFPRGAAAAFWTWLVATILFVIAYVDNGGPGGGRLDSVVLWTVSLGAMVGAIVWALVCVATTILGARVPGMSLERVPVSAWAFCVFSLVGIFGLPVLMGELLLGYLDTKYGYLPTSTDRLSLLSIGNSASLAPALYWIAIPTLGLAVEAIGVHTGRAIRFHRSVMAAIGLFGILAFGADLLSFSGRGRDFSFDNGLLVFALLVAIVPALATLALAGDSLKAGSPKLRSPLIGALAAGLLTVLGVVVGALGTIDPIIGFIEDVSGNDINASSALVLNGTAFHEGLRAFVTGAAVVGAIAALQHWGHKIWGRSLSEGLGLLAVFAAAVGTLAWGIGGVGAGFLEAPLLMVDSDVKDGVELLNLVSVAGVVLLAAAAAITVVNVLGAFAGRGSSVEPWTGLTLEWATDSPPARSNFTSMPIVHSATPLADASSTEKDPA